MSDAIPEVDKVLIIGWKAGEQRFLSTLAERMKRPPHIMCVSSSQGHASELVIRLQQSLGSAGVLARYTVGKAGFSYVVKNHTVDEFLKLKPV